MAGIMYETQNHKRQKNTGTAGNPGCWVFIVDYHGYSWLVDTNPRTALLAAQLLAHYPERCLAVGVSEFIIIFAIVYI
jgi:hypothetical protein